MYLDHRNESKLLLPCMHESLRSYIVKLHQLCYTSTEFLHCWKLFFQIHTTNIIPACVFFTLPQNNAFVVFFCKFVSIIRGPFIMMFSSLLFKFLTFYKDWVKRFRIRLRIGHCNSTKSTFPLTELIVEQ